MPFELASFVESLQDIQDAEQYWNTCHQAFEQLGVKSVCYGFIPFSSEVKEVGLTDSMFLKTTHVQEWQNMMKLNGYESELSSELVVEEFKTLIWHDHSQWINATEEQIQTANIEREMGMHTGITIPISDPIFSFSTSGIGLNIPEITENEFDRYWQANETNLNQIACLLEQGISKQHGKILVNLSGREKDCLSYLAIGLRPDEIAFRLGISTKTLETHIYNAKKKLKARTRDNAVAKALIMGLIQP